MAKKKKRRPKPIGNGIVIKMLTFFVFCFAVFGALTVFFKIQIITVTGSSPYSDEEIIAASEIEIGDNTFFVNKFSAIAKIFASSPYLDEISMKRKLPSELEIIVKQSVPIAVVECEEGQILIDIKGKILEMGDFSDRQDLVRVKGAVPHKPEVGKKIVFSEKEKEQSLLNVLNVLKNYDIIEQIKVINVEKVYNITFEYGDRYEVHLGMGDKLEDKIKLLLAVEKELGATDKGIIDVSDCENIRFRPK